MSTANHTIGDLFDIEWGQKEYHNKEHLEGQDGQTILISSKGEDNGVYGFFEIPVFYKAPFITVPSTGTIGQAFVQTRDCCVNDDVLILVPKKKMELEALYQITQQIRATKWKYQYGRKITPDRIRGETIKIVSLKKDITSFQKNLIPPKKIKTRVVHPKKIRLFKLGQLFDVQKGDGLYLEKMSEGNTPMISTQMQNNGVCGFYDIEPIFKARTITIGRIMCNPCVQLKDYATVPDDMFVLSPKIEADIPFLFYVSAIIKTEGWRFNYCRKATREKLKLLDIPLPVREGEIDFNYIKQVIENCYGFEALQVNVQ